MTHRLGKALHDQPLAQADYILKYHAIRVQKWLYLALEGAELSVNLP